MVEAMEASDYCQFSQKGKIKYIQQQFYNFIEQFFLKKKNHQKKPHSHPGKVSL